MIKNINAIVTPSSGLRSSVLEPYKNVSSLNPIPPIEVLENPVKNPISASDEIKAKDIWQR